MEPKNKLKSKKTSEILSSEIESNNSIQAQIINEFIEVGAICGDGTFTQNTGRGAGSHHNGVRYKLYAKKSELYQSEKVTNASKITTITTDSSTLSSKFEQSNSSKQSNQQTPLSSSQKKKLRKISLKDSFKTKAKKSAIFQRIHAIFEKLYKDQLPIVEQQLDEDLWLIVASVCNLYDQLEDSTNQIKALENSLLEEVNKKLPGSQKDFLNNDFEAQSLELKALKKQNQSITKENKQLVKSNNQLIEELQQHKSRQINFKKMLKVIEKQNPNILNNALKVSNINAKDLKKQKKHENRVTTRSMLKKQESKTEEKKIESLFSSDEQYAYNQENTIVGLIKGMK